MEIPTCPCGQCCSDDASGASALSADGRWFAAYASCCLVDAAGLPGVALDCHASIRAVVDAFPWRDCERHLFKRVCERGGPVLSGDGWFSVAGVRRRSRNARRIAAACVLLRRPTFAFSPSVTREQHCIQLYDAHERCSRRYGVVYAAALAVLREP